jgi:predicted metal-dependent hydrolase
MAQIAINRGKNIDKGVSHIITENVTDGKNSVQYILTRSKRKTVGIKLNEKGEVSVTAPLGLSGKQVREIIIKKIPWIVKKQEELKGKYKEPGAQKKYIDGDSFLYLGKEYNLKIQRGSDSENVALCGNDIVVSITGDTAENGNIDDKEWAETIKRLLRGFYINRFLEVIKDRIDNYASKIGVYPKKVTIREQNTRWGSCSSKGNINLNRKLVMAPSKVIDYVIVHELCHMREMNHSKNFWNIVSEVCPDFKESQKWLKDNGHRMTI